MQVYYFDSYWSCWSRRRRRRRRERKSIEISLLLMHSLFCKNMKSKNQLANIIYFFLFNLINLLFYFRLTTTKKIKRRWICILKILNLDDFVECLLWSQNIPKLAHLVHVKDQVLFPQSYQEDFFFWNKGIIP